MDHIAPADLPPMEQLPTVLAAARHGTFSLAAAELGLTHGAVSRRIAAVEQWLGYRIFDRHGRGVRPTAEGQRFIARIEEAFIAIAQSSERWKPRRGAEVVRISLLPSFAKLWLFQRLVMLEGEPRDIRVEPVIEHAFADLAETGCDLAIRCGRGGWPGVRAIPMAEELAFPVTAPALARRLGGEPAPADLLRHPLIHDSDGSGWKAWYGSLGMAFRPRPQDLRFEDYDVVLSAAEAGLGIALARMPYVTPQLAAGRLVRCHAHECPNPVRFHLVTRQGELRDPVCRLIDRILDAARTTGA